ncbi:hypothetical protein ACO34A_10610 [Rhizobium sp. ACO-34A]|nr:hypothetical protein [Rhizobium sp. ACO-34A]ATN34252.1 hypothetical protein ACO34A_10610 [Rhizobium sp. ACO-34A]
MANTADDAHDHSPLISNRFLFIVTSAIAALALLSLAVHVFGRSFGQELALAGHTDNPSSFTIAIGQDQLQLEANTIRFEDQRHDGKSERVDLYLLWPEMTGYSKDLRRRFDDITSTDSLIFLQISQSTMSRDMSGRVGPIYSLLFDGSSQNGPAGLTLHKFRRGTGYDNETLLTADLPDGKSYAVRCILPADPSLATSGDCQRDIHIGKDLTVLYRFSSLMLTDWQTIDEAIRIHLEARLKTSEPSPSHKMRRDQATNDSL